MWLLRRTRRGGLEKPLAVSILLVVDVALEDGQRVVIIVHLAGVSILLVVDVALEGKRRLPPPPENIGFNPSCSGCGS